MRPLTTTTPPDAPANALRTNSSALQPRQSTGGSWRGTASCHLELFRLVHLEVHLEHLEDIQVATLEASLGVMGLLEDEATQSYHRCLGDQAVTGCIGVIETCRRLIQVRILFCISFLATHFLYIAVSSNAIWEILVDWIILSTHPGIFCFRS